MIRNMHLPRGARQRRAQSLAAWQRVLVAGALIVALLISGALIYFQPGSHTFSPSQATFSAPGAKPALPPGFDTYYYWGQHQPISQQP